MSQKSRGANGKQVVIISVNGGVAEVELCPSNVVVYIHDQDIEHCEACGSNEDLLACNKCGFIACTNCETIGGNCECGGTYTEHGEYNEPTGGQNGNSL